ncbi:MAG: serine/threonine-protein kinase [Planctomycetota bacterium]|nr:serine/threonine-protein kinase [Planctomycetota bacterium]
MKNTSTDIGQLTETLDFQIEGAFSGHEGSEIMDSSSVTSASDMGSRIGKGPHELSHETRRLLQKRLRAACVVLLFGFALFMIRGFFVLFPLDIRVLHLALMLFLLIGVIGLTAIEFRLGTLRFFEVSTFILVDCYLLATLWIQLHVAQLEDNPVAAVNAVKVTMLFTLILLSLYCMFIPNRWQKAAVMAVFFVFGLPAVLVASRLFSAPIRDWEAPIATLGNIAENELILLTAATAAVFGTHVINRLRGEVFEARQLGQYRLGVKIGAGGMGEVYLAEHKLMRRPCAIKVIRPERASDQKNVERFAQEVQAAARLSHWNTVEVYDYGKSEDGVFFFVMELLNGLSFQELVDQGGPLPPERVIYLVLQICEALEEAELVQLVHRDIKPSNLFTIIRGGRHDVAKLTDFGLVQSTQSSTNERNERRAISGSPLYMSPEQARGEKPDHRSDLYSLGVVLYFLLSGRPPFQGKNAIAILVSHSRDEVEDLKQLCPELPVALCDIVMKCLRKLPEERIQTAQQLKHALENVELENSWGQTEAMAWWASMDDSMLDLIRQRTSAGSGKISHPLSS